MGANVHGFPITGKGPVLRRGQGSRMVSRVTQSAIVIVLTAMTLAGCGRQTTKSSVDLSRPTAGPEAPTLAAPRPFVSAALEAAGSLAAWQQCGKIERHGAVTVGMANGSFYLTEHDFVVYPWSDAIQVTAYEPQADLTWEVVGEQYRPPQVDPNRDVSPLREWRREYADAVLQITTAPVRILQDNLEFTLAPTAVQIAGLWYLAINARYQAPKLPSRQESQAEPYWTRGTYFQSQDNSRVDMIWLGNPATHKFILVRGYDYAVAADSGVLIPGKIEVFQSDPEANFGPRIARVDLGQ
jgi:hypothetical protein